MQKTEYDDKSHMLCSRMRLYCYLRLQPYTHDKSLSVGRVLRDTDNISHLCGDMSGVHEGSKKKE